MSKDRLETFSDGVFAIVLTLLVLELRAPSLPPHSNLARYAMAIAPLIPKVITFVLTFAVICIHWVSHHYFFAHIRRMTIGLLWLNNLFLLWMCFLPFPTAMLGNNPTDQFPILLYAANSLLAALNFFALRLHASRHGLFVEGDIAALVPQHSVPSILIYTVSIALAFVNAYLALACFFIVPLLYFVPNLIRSGSEE